MSWADECKIDPQVVAALYLEHADALRRFALGVLGDADAAADVLHATFAKLVEHGHTVREEGHKSWLFSVAYNEALAVRRRRAVEANAIRKIVAGASGNLGQSEREKSQSAEQRLIRWETVQQVRQAIERLPAEQRRGGGAADCRAEEIRRNRPRITDSAGNGIEPNAVSTDKVAHQPGWRADGGRINRNMISKSFESSGEFDRDWLALRHVGDEMPAAERAEFESLLADDQAAREAVAAAVELFAAVPLAMIDRSAPQHLASGVPVQSTGADCPAGRMQSATAAVDIVRPRRSAREIWLQRTAWAVLRRGVPGDHARCQFPQSLATADRSISDQIIGDAPVSESSNDLGWNGRVCLNRPTRWGSWRMPIRQCCRAKPRPVVILPLRWRLKIVRPTIVSAAVVLPMTTIRRAILFEQLVAPGSAVGGSFATGSAVGRFKRRDAPILLSADRGINSAINIRPAESRKGKSNVATNRQKAGSIGRRRHGDHIACHDGRGGIV